jgi:hypothetical protein
MCLLKSRQPCSGFSILRGRKAVRADRRLRTDEKRIRAQSTILGKCQLKSPLGFFQNRVFRADGFFIRTENTVGARSAQWPLLAPVSIDGAACTKNG